MIRVKLKPRSIVTNKSLMISLSLTMKMPMTTKAERARELFKEALISYENIQNGIRELEQRKARYESAKKALETFMQAKFEDFWFDDNAESQPTV